MNRNLYIVLTATLLLMFSAASAYGVRIKDLAQLHGVRSNQLLGYGLITGLSGTGDDMKKSVFTLQAVYNMMTRHGITIDPATIDDIKIKNVAAVMVTAELPPFAQSGATIDVQVSSMGDAKSLAGGTLLMTPLLAPDGNVYAVAQGPLTIGAFSYGGKAAQAQKNHPTVGRIANGAIVERSVPVELGSGGSLSLQLRSADFTTSHNIAQVINNKFEQDIAFPETSAKVKVSIPKNEQDNLVDFIASLESLEVQADTPARVVVNERTGTIVMGRDVRLSTVAVSHGNLSLVIKENPTVSQPNPFSDGQTVIAPSTNVTVVEEDGQLMVVDGDNGVSIGDIANALNAIGATPRDLIAIFQAIKASGSLHGELIVL